MLHALIPKRIPNNAIIIVPRKSRYVWINPTYLIVEEVSKTIEIINSRMYLYKAFVQTIEFIIFNCFLGIYGRYIPQKKPTQLLNNYG